MDRNDLITRLREAATQPMTRRGPLMLMGLLAGSPVLLAGCGTGTTPSQTGARPASGAAAAVPAVPTVAVAAPAAPAAVPATANAAAVTAGPITVTAREAGDSYLFEVDRLAIPAGPVQITFKNAGKMVHEVFLYPTQDLTAMVAQKRAGQKVKEGEFIKGLAGVAEDVEPGQSASFSATVKPGFYELACFARSKRPDGSTLLHYDMGQTVTIAVVGPGGPSADVLTPSSTLSIDFVPGEGDLAGSWLFKPDRLMAPAGDVTIKATNRMKEEHDVVVYPLGTVADLIPRKLSGEKGIYGTIKGEEIIADLAPGKTESKVKKLTPGAWVVACFMVSKAADGTSFVHRDKGQRFTFQVK